MKYHKLMGGPLPPGDRSTRTILVLFITHAPLQYMHHMKGNYKKHIIFITI